MKRNRTIKIGYKKWRMLFVNRVDADDSSGECDFETATIKICKRLTGIELASTIIHEINHAILHDRGVDLKPKDDELVVTAITNGSIAMLKDNPALMRMLLTLIDGHD